jgi:hypothetical protein
VIGGERIDQEGEDMGKRWQEESERVVGRENNGL